MMPVKGRGMKTENLEVNPQRERKKWRKIYRGKTPRVVEKSRINAVLREVEQMAGIIQHPPVVQNVMIQYPKEQYGNNREEERRDDL